MGTWDTTLQPRDLDGDGVTDAFFDTDLNITWLRNANVNGLMNWSTATAWAAALKVGSYDDWRLPSGYNSDGITLCGGTACADSEMGHLFSFTLGNHNPMLDIENNGSTGNFQGLTSGSYWSSTSHYGRLNEYIYFIFTGWQLGDFGYNPMHAMAVRDGDVSTNIPEPGIPYLIWIGLLALILQRKRVRNICS